MTFLLFNPHSPLQLNHSALKKKDKNASAFVIQKKHDWQVKGIPAQHKRLQCSARTKMLESRPEDALVKPIKIVETVESMETLETVETADTAHTACTDHTACTARSAHPARTGHFHHIRL